MGAQLRVLRRRIKSAQSIKKITKAMELVATSRVSKAQSRVAASMPYADAITNVMSTLSSSANVAHPLLEPRKTIRRAGVFVVTSDKGQCGGYNANALRTAERLIAQLRDEGKEPVLYISGRKGIAYYKFRDRALAGEWSGFSDQPRITDAAEISKTLLQAFTEGTEDGNQGVDELHIVHTRFVSLLTQSPQAKVLAPMNIEDIESEEEKNTPQPAYEFEPEPDALLDALLPKYLTTRVYAALIDASAAESASRRRAMKAATDNAEELIKTLTRERNAARQAEITQEISEIVGGASALAAAGSE
ncbi:MAG TPA: F0F1 ATP synthase subunit gamma [Candidatus Stackebrandtia faecavium]|nr:F0F1 ATP synthase subunit gamma [Candidatus Stackebrandtia faecavium]